MFYLIHINAYFILLRRNKKQYSMEKKNVLTLLVLYSPDTYSQIGINTTDPKITLDIAGAPTQPAILVNPFSNARVKLGVNSNGSTM